MKTLKSKVYTFRTINQNDEVEKYEVECFTLREAKEYRNNIIANTQRDEKICGRITLVKRGHQLSMFCKTA